MNTITAYKIFLKILHNTTKENTTDDFIIVYILHDTAKGYTTDDTIIVSILNAYIIFFFLFT